MRSIFVFSRNQLEKNSGMLSKQQTWLWIRHAAVSLWPATGLGWLSCWYCRLVV